MTIQEFEIFHGKKLYKSANNCRLIINHSMFNRLADLNPYERKNIFHKIIVFLQEQVSKDRTWINSHIKEIRINNKELNATIERHEAVQLVFKYWKEIGKNKAKTKDPYKCREFMQYLDAINFTEADYLIIGKP
ncbi:hypothetical protein [Veillonella parvula]|uniref:hypothetical protein n=1 Tax=Veillonella parvula TaxID=29466 RepID=UPI0028EEF457|nr:hypothetical protein [Veillonella parvula]